MMTSHYVKEDRIETIIDYIEKSFDKLKEACQHNKEDFKIDEKDRELILAVVRKELQLTPLKFAYHSLDPNKKNKVSDQEVILWKNLAFDACSALLKLKRAGIYQKNVGTVLSGLLKSAHPIADELIILHQASLINTRTQKIVALF